MEFLHRRFWLLEEAVESVERLTGYLAQMRPQLPVSEVRLYVLPLDCEPLGAL